MIARIKYITILALLALAQIAVAQQRVLGGVVTDETGDPLAGASVVVEGTTNGTIADADGHWQLTASPGDVLRFEFIGFMPMREKVGQTNRIDVVMRM